MKISVIIPAYNCEKTISRAIDSINNQVEHGFDVEIIIINDKSTDSTGYIIKDLVYKFRNIIYIENDKNMGVSHSRNVGLKIASGEYIFFLDADDYYQFNKFSVFFSILNDFKPQFIFHGWEYNNISSPKGTGKVIRLKKWFLYLNLIRNKICTPCVVMKNTREFFFDEKLSHMEDLELWTRIIFSSKENYIINSPLTILGHELNKGTGLSSDNEKMREMELVMYRRLLEKHYISKIQFYLYKGIHLIKKCKDFYKAVSRV
ncbi:glycosyltransferase family 2 protein [Photobacterium damselae]|uniref:glycosyltransferase family 2 protein n=1 Tax=Photobacterium damselae TaxID=38293 RepID=UPI0025434D51